MSKVFIISLNGLPSINSFEKYLLKIYYAPGLTSDLAMNIPFSGTLYFSIEETDVK